MSRLRRLYWATESRLERGPDGVVRSPHPGDWYPSYGPMLEQFGEVVLVARVAPVDTPLGQEVEGPDVRVAALPTYVGTRQAIARLSPLARRLWQKTPDSQAYFGGRLPGTIASLLLWRAKAYRRPFLANIVGDPHSVLATGTLGPIVSALGPLAGAVLRHQVQAADAVIYVTERYLQQKYPARPSALQLARSNVTLPPAAFASPRRTYGVTESFRLISVGTQEQLYKGHDLLIRTVAELSRAGGGIELHLVGSGRCQPELRELAHRLGVEDQVVFHGHVQNASRVRELLDTSDAYIQPSRTEGMPRALLEAMARGLPCAGSDAGGIPELLDPDLVFPVDDLAGLVATVSRLRDEPNLREQQGERNKRRARAVADLAMPERYSAFLGRFAQLSSADSSEHSPSTTVVHLLGSLDRGGAEMRTLQLVKRIDLKAFRTHVITLSGRVGTLEKEYRAAGVSIHPLRIYSWSFPWRFIGLLRSEGVDVVHSHVHLASGALLLLARLAGVQIRIAHFRTDGPLRRTAVLRVRDALMRLLLHRSATQVLGVSPSALQAAFGRRPSARLPGQVIPNGVDLTVLDPGVARDIRAEIVATPCEPIIVHLGRADIPTKNRAGAIRYFSAYRRSGGDGTLVFVGRDGGSPVHAATNRRTWTELARQLDVADHIVFLGERDDIADILVSADLLLFTSTLEGLPGVILEARALGTPVVASTVPGAVYLAERLSGIRLVSVEDEETLWATAIKEAVRQRSTPTSRRLSHDALRGSVFDAAATAKSFEKVWNERR